MTTPVQELKLQEACGDKKLVQIYNALELAHDNYSGAVGNGAIELRNKFSPVLNKAIEKKVWQICRCNTGRTIMNNNKQREIK